MKIKILLTATSAVLLAGLTFLSAQDAPATPPPAAEKPPGPPEGGPKPGLGDFFKKIDTNGDGKVSKDEYLAHAQKEAEERFTKVDGNTDGSIEKSEFEDAAKKMQAQRPNGPGPKDGPRNRPEGPRGEGRGDRGDRKDGPRDGERGDRQDGPRDGDRPPGGPRDGADRGGFKRPDGQGPGPQDRGNMIGARLKSMDKDGDGNISKEEYLASSEEQFTQLDENKDGKVSAEELQEAGRRFGFGARNRADGERGPRGPQGGPENAPQPPAEPAPAPAPVVPPNGL